MLAAVYVVVSLYLSGRGKKIWKAGNTVKPEDFENFDKLIAGKYIKRVDAPADTPIDASKPLLIFVEREGETVEITSEEDINKAEIIQLLSEIEGLEFNKKDTKPVLWELLIKSLNS